MKNMSEIILIPSKDSKIVKVTVNQEFWDEVVNEKQDAHQRYEDSFQSTGKA